MPYATRIAYYKEYYAKNQERIVERREKQREAQRAYCKEHYKKNRARYLEYQLIAKYGITSQQKQDLIDKQNGCCANKGCDRKPTAVDHCHTTNKVRGILCAGCNTAFGLLKESPERILGLLNYGEDAK